MDTTTGEYTTVTNWIERSARYWGTDEAVFRAQAPAVLKFCDEIGLDPDALIDDCMTEKNGRRVATLKAVRRYWKSVRAFGSREGSASAAVVMSFFIYNGVLMQCPGAEP
jgi:hypothetical protein